ncbi:E3 ubiquitin/ISG15 ligase TRIM25-like [Megalops cyprinoides]|uniref:E3 ubiquitin/ISG15 ligase TRIM25-like n=1 Tax=Megalops cyprinoides TaxID=118141 RepID=UPI0018650F96|nr:E3 ubiquitin/ISG15 ligase TRIM25-like [Megalops cyprinoides]
MAGVSEDSVLEGELTCSVCLEVFQDPHLLACGHSFCLRCLKGVRKKAQGGSFRCPECRETHRCSGSFQKNYKLANIAEDYRRRGCPPQEPPPPVLCDYCSLGEQAAAAKTCLKCEVSMCAEHVKPHLELPAFREHPLTEPLGDVKERKCPEHDEAFRYYCADDSVCVCTACTIEGRHAGHTIKTLKNAMKDLKQDALQPQLQRAVRKLAQTEKELQKHSKHEGAAQRFVEEAERQVCAAGEQLQVQLDGFLSALRECVRAHSGTGPELQENLSRISQDRERLQEVHSGIEALLQENDPFRFVQEYRTAAKRFSSSLKMRLCVPDWPNVEREELRESMEARLEEFENELRLKADDIISSVCAENDEEEEDEEDEDFEEDSEASDDDEDEEDDEDYGDDYDDNEDEEEETTMKIQTPLRRAGLAHSQSFQTLLCLQMLLV